jgi:hypothetical protein
MRDINRGSEISPQREALLKAEAFFDAAEYLKLMRQKNPESAQIKSGLGIVINLVEGEKFFSVVKEKLNLSPDEMQVYLGFLAERAEQILKNQSI